MLRFDSVKGTSPAPKKTAASKSSTTSSGATKTGTAAKKKTTTTTTTTKSRAAGGLKKSTGLRKGTKTGAKKKAKGPTPEELALQKKQNEAALVIQSSFRGFKTKKEQEIARQKKEEMEKQMEEFRKQAWLAEIERQRKLDAERRKKHMEEAKRRKEEVSLRKKLLEMAYDGEIEDLEKNWPRAREVFKGDACVEVADGHGTTLLSEAAAGGQAETVRWLIEKGAFPNSLGGQCRAPEPSPPPPRAASIRFHHSIPPSR